MTDDPVRRALVVTSSTRAAAGVWEDRSGPVVAEGLTALGLVVIGPVVVADGEPLREALLAGVAAVSGRISLEAVSAAIREKFPSKIAEGNVAAANAAHAFVENQLREAASA